MKKDITVRKINKNDYDELADMIAHTWGYENFCSPKIAHQMGLLYLANCLHEQTFHTLAIKEKQIVGIIMGKNFKGTHKKLTSTWLLLKSSMAMVFSKEGRRVLKMFRGFDAINEKLLKDRGKTYDAALSFFMVKHCERGSGVGGRLYEEIMTYFTVEEVKSFYLFTDTSCNYGFYEHKGLKRVGEQKIDFKPYADRTLSLFLYECEKE